MNEGIRTFIAIDLPTEVKEGLSTFTETLKGRGLSDVRWVKPGGIHLTLKFLGDIPPSTVPLLLARIHRRDLVRLFRPAMGDEGRGG